MRDPHCEVWITSRKETEGAASESGCLVEAVSCGVCVCVCVCVCVYVCVHVCGVCTCVCVGVCMCKM